MPVGKVKQISRNMDRRCRSSWTGVHEFFSQRSMMQEHRKQAKSKQKVEDNWICTNAHFEDIFEFEKMKH
jgi:hypothetical protein